jgi:hypothetical protein
MKSSSSCQQRREGARDHGRTGDIDREHRNQRVPFERGQRAARGWRVLDTGSIDQQIDRVQFPAHRAT